MIDMLLSGDSFLLLDVAGRLGASLEVQEGVRMDGLRAEPGWSYQLYIIGYIEIGIN